MFITFRTPVLFALCASVLLTVLLPVFAHGQTTLDSLRVDPSTIDISGGDQSPTVTMYLRHPSGLMFALVYFGNPDSSILEGFGILTSGTALDGSWEATVTVPQNTLPGTYPVYVMTFDSSFSTETINSGVSVTITGGESDPPVLASAPVVSPTTVDVSGGMDTVTVDFDLTDNSSGVAFVFVSFERGDTLTAASGYGTLVSGDSLAGSWQSVVLVPQNAAGIYDLRITAIDHASNSLDTLAGPTLTVTGGDTVMPSVTGTPAPDRAAVNVGAGPQEVTLTLVAHDTYSGIASVDGYFLDDSGNSSGSSSVTTLLSGDSLDGTWQLQLTFDETLPAGSYHLRVILSDAAGNSAEIEFPLVVVEVSRAPEALVTFRLDTRRPELLGLLLRAADVPAVSVFGGPNQGRYELVDPDLDSVWTVSVLIQTGQAIHYAYALPSAAGDIFELGGEAGGRDTSVDSTGALILAVAYFDDLPPTAVDPGAAVVANEGLAQGNPSPVEFSADTAKTFVTLDFSGLDRNALAAVRRYEHSGGGTPPPGIATLAPQLFWGISTAPSGTVFSARIAVGYDFFGGIADPSALRLLRRTDGGQPWEIVPTIVNTDLGTLESPNVTSFSEWTIGSTTALNTLIPSAPGAAGVPIPPDSSIGAGLDAQLSWSPAPGAYSYDLYVWADGDTMPETPTAAGLRGPSGPSGANAWSQAYHWRVVARNIASSTPGPVWTFTTMNAADLTVTDVQVPGGAFSGQGLEVSWTVTNNGATGTTSPAWRDKFYLSIDSVLVPQIDQYLGDDQNPAALAPGESYTSTRTFIIPQGAFGTRRLIVVTDALETQTESNENNNRFIRDVSITLSPAPDLRVDAVSVPAAGFSGQEIPLLYTVKNHGTNVTGSSLWYDAVFLSPDSVLNPLTAVRLLTVNRTALLQPDSSYTISQNVRLPDTVSGTRFIIATTDLLDHVFEAGLEDNNTRSAGISIALSPPPDLAVTSVSAPASGNSGAAATIGWTVTNQGSADAFTSWSDRVTIGTGAAFDPDSVTFIGTFRNPRTLARDSSYTRVENIVLPEGISGPYHVFVETDWKAEVFEQIFESNNVLAAPATMTVALSPWPDLSVDGLFVPTPEVANDLISVSWTVRNDGSGAIASGSWVDSLYLSPTAAFVDSTAVALVGVPQNRALGASETYIATTTVRLPADLSSGSYYLLLKTDGSNTVFEHTDEGNNLGVSEAIPISAYPPVDLDVVSVTAGPAGASGVPLSIGFTIANAGSAATLVSSWDDVVYLSPDTSLDYGSDLRVATVPRSAPLGAGDGYARSISPALPNGISGDYYVIVAADSGSKVNDAQPLNNIARSAAPVNVVLSAPPDLRVTATASPASGSAGQPVTVTWTVDNSGAGIAAEQRWFDGLFLSSDAVADAGDVRLGSVERSGPLPNGGGYTDTIEAALPEYASGTYYILAKADSRQEVYEQGSEANNVAGSLIAIDLPAPTDLVVGSITVPPAGTVGEDVLIEWTIRNDGVNSATGRLTDAVYFSADTVWDLGDLLLGTATRVIDLAPGATAAGTLRASLAAAALADSNASVVDETPGLFPGPYHVIVRADVRNNIRESDNSNNTGSSSSIVDVDVPLLTPGVPDSGSISSASPRHYRIDAPGGIDLRIRATSSVAYPSIDLFTAFDRMPTGNSYDYRNDDPVALERELLVPSTSAGAYYLLMRSIIDPSPFVTESYTVVAETLGFSVESAGPDNGGSGGRVTCRILGAGFRPDSRVFLYDGAVQVAEAELREFRSTMELLVRWDLRNAPLGTYDVEVRNQDNSTARLTAGFRVDPMRDPKVAIGKNVPRVLLDGRPESYSFSFSNLSNVDIPYFLGMIAVPPGTEIAVESYSPGLLRRSDLVADSLVPEGETVDDWIESSDARFVPLIGRDLAPGENFGCRVTFRNSAYHGGMDFPMTVTSRSLSKETFLEIQLSQIETYRARVLQQPAGTDPEYLARANDPVAFAQYALGAYVPMGLLDSADAPGVTMRDIAVAAAGPWAGGAQSTRPIASPRLPAGIMEGAPGCEAFILIECPAAIIDCFIDIPFVPPPVSLGLCAFGIATSCFGADFGPLNIIGCFGPFSAAACLSKEYLCKHIAFSYDPNDITGPDGVGDERWVDRGQTLPYTIRFENDSTKAIVPARRVTVSQDLDSTADVRSVRLGAFGFGRNAFQPPANVATYNDRLDLRDSMGIYVDVTAGIDVVNRKISWTFNSIDPVTGGPPADPFTGFLPVDDSVGRGRGFVSYTIRPNPAAATRDTIHAKATIVFDSNDPLDTPPVFNIVDAAGPASSVRPLPPVLDIASFPVHWGGVDDSAGSGVRHYTIYVSRDGGPYEVWLPNAADTIAVYSGVDSVHYAFFSVATDTAGNTEQFKSSAEASTTVLTAVGPEEEGLPKRFALTQNYPNPFNPSTEIGYDVPSASWVRLAVYNVLGQEVAVLVNGTEAPGRKVVEWSALNRHGMSLASGVYFYRMEASPVADPSAKFRDVKKMMLVR